MFIPRLLAKGHLLRMHTIPPVKQTIARLLFPHGSRAGIRQKFQSIRKSMEPLNYRIHCKLTKFQMDQFVSANQEVL